MADGYAAIDEPHPTAVDKRVDCDDLTVGTTAVLRQRVRIAGAAAGDLAEVTAGQVKVTDAGLGTDGATPPAISGTGVRGWLRAIYERLVAGVARSWALSSTTDSVTTVPSGTQTVAGTVAVSGQVGVTDAGGSLTIDAATLPLPTGAASDATLLDVKRALTDYETRLDYAGRTDANPVYVGKAAQGAATTTTWVVQRLEYDASGRLTRAQVLQGPWDNRAALAWS